MWSIWDKTSPINGKPAVHVFTAFNHLKGEETIYLKTINNHVTNVEGKSILAHNYGIDYNLPDDEFIAAYEAAIAEPIEEAIDIEGAPYTYTESDKKIEPEPEEEETQ